MRSDPESVVFPLEILDGGSLRQIARTSSFFLSARHDDSEVVVEIEESARHIVETAAAIGRDTEALVDVDVVVKSSHGHSQGRIGTLLDSWSTSRTSLDGICEVDAMMAVRKQSAYGNPGYGNSRLGIQRTTQAAGSSQRQIACIISTAFSESSSHGYKGALLAAFTGFSWHDTSTACRDVHLHQRTAIFGRTVTKLHCPDSQSALS